MDIAISQNVYNKKVKAEGISHRLRLALACTFAYIQFLLILLPAGARLKMGIFTAPTSFFMRQFSFINWVDNVNWPP